MRLIKLKESLADHELCGLLITTPENRRYLSGFTGSSGWLFMDQENRFLITDSPYWEQAGREAKDVSLVKADTRQEGAMFRALADLLSNLGVKWRVGFEGRSLSFADHAQLLKQTDSIEWASTTDLVEELRAIKEPEEIEIITRAASLTDRVFQTVAGKLRAGVTEKSLGAEIHYLM